MMSINAFYKKNVLILFCITLYHNDHIIKFAQITLLDVALLLSGFIKQISSFSS